MIFQGKCIHNAKPVFLQRQRQRGSQRRPEHLTRKVVLVVPRPRPKYDSTLAPDRIPDLTDPRSARAFLPPRLSTASRNLGPRLRLVGAGALTRQVLLDGVVQEALINRTAKHVVGKIKLA